MPSQKKWVRGVLRGAATGLGARVETVEARRYASGTRLSASPPPGGVVGTDLAAPIVVAAVKSATSIGLTWKSSAAGVAGFNVLRSTDGASYDQIAHLASAKTLTYTDATAASYTRYTYEVQAYNVAGATGTSVPVVAQTPVAPVTALAGQGTLSDDGDEVTLTWTDHESAATGVGVLRSDNGGKNFTRIATLDEDAAAFTDTNVAAGRAYTYQVIELVGTATSAGVAAAVLTPLAAPSRTSAVAGVATNGAPLVNLSWAANDTGATGYAIFRSTDGVKYATLAKVAGLNTLTYQDKGLSSLKTYYYKVATTTAATSSGLSGAASTSTPLAIPGSLAATALGATSVKLTWADADPAATGYYILRADAGSDDFEQVGQVTGNKTLTFTDATAASNTAYRYEVQAYATSNSSGTSAAAGATTLLSAPAGLSALAADRHTVNVAWTGTDDDATAYLVLRSADGGKTFAQLARIAGQDAGAFADTSVAAGAAYAYSVRAVSEHNQSLPTAAVPAVTPLAAPSGLSATALSGNSVRLAWADNDTAATGYYILRSADAGAHFTQLAKLTGSTAATYTDATAASVTAYVYEVKAGNTATTSSASGMATVTTTLNAPTNLTVTAAGAVLTVGWTAKDSAATGYSVLRSTDGITFSAVGSTDAVSAVTFSDASVSAGTKYWYEAVATRGEVASAASAANSATVATPSTGTVAIASRFSTELVITATGAHDAISISQSDAGLTIIADGVTTTADLPANGLFIYARGGADSITLDSSLTLRTTIAAIDGAATAIMSAGANVSAWFDAADSFSGTGTQHSVSAYAMGTAKTTSVALAQPKDAGATTRISSRSLWGSGPVADDINQGSVGDCYFMSSLAAFAGVTPDRLRESAVDLGDGTTVVQFIKNNQSAYYRLSDDFSTGGFRGFKYAYPANSASAPFWAMALEKAYTYFRTGASTYASISSGWMGDVYGALGVSWTSLGMSSQSASSFFSTASASLAAHRAVTFGTPNPSGLVAGHAYTLVAVTNDDGVAHYRLRNPWGQHGSTYEDANGYVTLTFDQLKAWTASCCLATA